MRLSLGRVVAIIRCLQLVEIMRHGWIIAIAALSLTCTNNVAAPDSLVDAENCRTQCVDADAELDAAPDDADASSDTSDPDAECETACSAIEVDSIWTSSKFTNCAYASAQVWNDNIIAMGGGRVVNLDPDTGDEIWRFEIPVPDGQFATIIATPAIVADLLVGEYHTTEDGGSKREEHFVYVLDLNTGELAADFEPWRVNGTFDGNGLTIPFTAANALGRAHILHGMLPDSVLGRVYVTYGNARDIQPWHGFAFELDLDVWKQSGPDAAVMGSLITTPELDCGTPGESGSRDRFCGGGLWSPSGSLLIDRGDTYDIIMATGNGQLDLNRNDFANTIFKVGPGLDLQHGCDENLCAEFDPDDPALDCIQSCQNVFVPRDNIGDPFPYPESGVCEGMTMFECWARLDYIGGSTPVHFELGSGTEVLAYPTKDGSVYLVDAEHMGTMYDREQLVPICGTADDACDRDWAGMIVTQPAVPTITDRPTIIVPTFMQDRTHVGGIVALAIDESSGTPTFERLWSIPDVDSPEARERFRRHPSRIGLQRVSDDLEIGWIVESVHSGKAQMLAFDVATGNVLVDVTTASSGMRYTKPLFHDGKLFINHCPDGLAFSDGHIEAWRVDVNISSP